MTHKSKALICGLATVAIWSTVATAFKITLRHLDPLQLLLLACTTSLVILFMILAWQKRLHTLRMPKKEFLRCALLGILNPFLYYALLFKAYDLLPAQEAQPLNFTWAITLSLLSVPLLGQRLSLRSLLAILTSYTGVLIISTHGNIFAMSFKNPTGVGLALATTVIWALYWIYNVRSQADPVTGLLVNFAAGLPFILIATLCFSSLPLITFPALAGSVYIGAFEMGISFVLWLTALKNASMPNGGGTARIANLIFLSPFLSLAFIHAFVGEQILPSTIIGLIFILAGNALMQTGKN